MCDTREMCDALNGRIHGDTDRADAPTVTGARGQRIGVGDLIISRRNDASIAVVHPTDKDKAVDLVRNGNRWRVAAVDAETNRLAAERLGDRARVVFEGDYLREHVSLGYAVTVHSAQGVTADTTHAVLGENTTRSMLYVAMTRGRDTNTAYLYERVAEHEYGADAPDDVHIMRRGSSRHAGQLMRSIIATHDEPHHRTRHRRTSRRRATARHRPPPDRPPRHGGQAKTRRVPGGLAHSNSALLARHGPGPRTRHQPQPGTRLRARLIAGNPQGKPTGQKVARTFFTDIESVAQGS